MTGLDAGIFHVEEVLTGRFGLVEDEEIVGWYGVTPYRVGRTSWVTSTLTFFGTTKWSQT